jgi:hypothetical protein
MLSCSVLAGRESRNLCPISEESLRHPQLPPGAREIVIAQKKKAWERALGGEEAARPYIRARLTGWPERLLVNRQTLPESDEEFAWRVARDTWRGLTALTDRENGLPVDNVRFPAPSAEHGSDRPPADADSQIGDYASSSNIGLHLISIVAAHELHFVPQAQAVEKIRRVLDTLDHLETYRGFFFNFYDTTSLERTSNFVSFVDSAWLTAGLMVVRMTFPELSEHCTQLIARANYGFFYNRGSRLMSHGYYVKQRARSPFEYGMLYTEARLGSLIAIGKGEVPADNWFQMVRTFPVACTWQTLTPQAMRIKTVNDHEFSAGFYEWNGVRYVPSWGGSMFEALMPALLLDEPRYAPRSLGANDRAHAVVQRRHALENLGYQVWGMSPSATPTGNGYAEYGVKVLGARGYDAGAVTPYASALALAVTPEAALANLRTLAASYDIYGEYGFYDAVDPRSRTVAYTYLALDQSMLFIAMANYLNDHCIQKRFASDPIGQKVLPTIADEDFFD